MKNYDQSIEINHNKNSPFIPDHPYLLVVQDQEKLMSY